MSGVTWFTTGKTATYMKFSQIKAFNHDLGNSTKCGFLALESRFLKKQNNCGGMSLKFKLWAGGDRQAGPVLSLASLASLASSRPVTQTLPPTKGWVVPEG